METMLQDVRYAVRGLGRARGFTLVALLTLTLGIGVNSAIFSLVNAVLFKPLPVAHPEELVAVYGHEASSPTHETHSYPNYADYRRELTSLAGLVGYSNFFAHASIHRTSSIIVGELATDNYFDVLGVRPQLGRLFGATENAPAGGAAVAVLSDRLWHAQFGGRADVIGQTLRLNGLPYTIIGVAPPEFRGMMPAVTAQMWIPVAMVDHVEPLGNHRTSGRSRGASRLERRGDHWLWLTGRLRANASVAQVRAELDVIARRLTTTYPETNAHERVSVVPASDVRFNPDLDRTVAPAGLVLVAAVGLVLVVACANLANLMLARAAGRRREIAVRSALGASRSRLLRQMLTESMVLAVAGGLVALPLAAALVRVIMRAQPPLPIDVGIAVGVDWRVLAFNFVTAIGTGVVFGLVPALRASRPELVPALKSGGAAIGRRRVELRDVLVVVQMAVSLTLLVCGTLLVRSLEVASRVDLGYDADRLARVSLATSMNGYDRERGPRLIETARQRIAAMPGVVSVALTSRTPLSLNYNGFGLFIEGRQTSASDKPFAIDGTYADEHYLETLGLRLLDGRWIEPADRDANRHVAVITSAMADRFWPGQSAVGRTFRTSWGGEPYRIIGVVADYRVDTPGETRKSYIHLPFGRAEGSAEFVVRTSGAADRMVGPIERTMLGIDPNLVFPDAGTLRAMANLRLFPVRAGAWLVGAFGLLALAVAAVGLYGVIGYSVGRRVREMGIRKALGARPTSLMAMVLRDGMGLVAIGGIAGALVAGLAARALSSALYVDPFDARSFAIALGVLCAIALAANWIPARRAARVDPMVALRHE